MRLVARVIGGFLVMVVLIAGLAGYQLLLVHRLLDDNRELARVDLEVTRTTLDLHRQLDDLSRLTRVLFVRQDPGYPAQLAALRTVVDTALRRIGALELAAGERAALDDVSAHWRGYVALAEEAEPAALADAADGGDRVRELDLLAELSEVSAGLDLLDTASRTSARERTRASAEQAVRARTAAWVSTALALLLGVLLAILIARAVARPLAALGRGTHEMASGNFAFRVPVSGSPELASLAHDFNHMADRLGELDQLKKDFISNVSHDLKAPLASMQETTRLILDGPPGSLSEKQERFLRLQLACGERLSAMIADMLDSARLDSGTLRYDLARLDLAALAALALHEIHGSTKARELAVEADLPPAPVELWGDRQLLLRAMTNLLSNACKFSPPGSAIGVAVERFDEPSALAGSFRRAVVPEAAFPCASFAVWDSGPGIPDAQKGRVFDRFYRVDAVHRGDQGSGLGLSIARMVVEGHGGTLWVEDAAAGAGAPETGRDEGGIGSGSRFVMLLPLRGEDLPPPAGAWVGA